MDSAARKALSISIIIPVLKEEERINRFLEHIEDIRDDHIIEVIIIDGDKAGSTIGRVKGKDVQTIVSTISRAIQMNRGAREARGDVLLFLHADTCLPEKAFDEIEKVMHTAEYVGGSFDLGIDSPRWPYRLIEAAAALRYRSTKIPFGDQAIFLNRKYFEMLGGYKEMPLMEEVDLMKRIKRRGDKIVIIPLKTKTSARKWEEDGIIFRTLRNWAIQILYSVGVSPDTLVRYYDNKKAKE